MRWFLGMIAPWVVLVAGCCSVPPAQPGGIDPQTGIADPPPILCGTVLNQQGKPVFGATVHVYTGLATYFPLATVQTDPKGRYRVWITHGAGVLDNNSRRTDFQVGVTVDPPGHERQEGGLDWTGLVPNIPNHETRKDFTIQVDDPDAPAK